MSAQTLQPPSGSPQETIRLLQQELTETNREVLLLTVELDKRVEQRTAELEIAQEDLRQKNAELLKRTAELEEANKELETFSYSVSHDLRAPIRHIEGYVQLMLADQSAVINDAAQVYLNRISAAANLMRNLIDDLLAFSRMARSEMRQTRFSVAELLKEILQEMSDDTQNRNIQWEIQPLPVVEADRALFKQVWVNLVSNAVKYTRPRNPAKIKIGCVQTNGEWEFSLEDNGVGFDMRHAEKMFGVFQRLHSAEEFEGTGIGLANVRQIVSRHGGRTWAIGEVDKGATIYFSLPIPKSLC
jgi:light-regulated signal transduction histidine kinase (bacteriophytochrome)